MNAWNGNLAGQLAWRERLGQVAKHLDRDLYHALAAPERPESVETLERLGWRLHRARALARCDDAGSVARAATEFEGMRAEWRRGLALSRLAALGRPGRDLAAKAPDEMTPRQYSESMAPFSGRGVYVNNLGAEGADRVRAAYGPLKYERLVALKNRLDPENVFHLNQNIRPSTS